MRQYIRQLILSAGLLLVFISFLFYGRQAGTYMFLLTSGLLISLVSFIILLLSKKSRKTKIIWTIIVLLAAGLHYLTEPFLIKSSYLIYVYSNADELKAINNILSSHDGEINIDRYSVVAKSSQLSAQEIQRLKHLREKVDAYIIWKSNSSVYYGLYGFLDIRLGVVYVITGDKPTMQMVQRHLVDKWFY